MGDEAMQVSSVTYQIIGALDYLNEEGERPSDMDMERALDAFNGGSLAKINDLLPWPKRSFKR